MAKHDPQIAQSLIAIAPGCDTLSDKDLLSALNPVIVSIEKDDTYSTKAKLKIFSLLTMLCNVEAKDRKKYMKKVISAVR